ncbi:hypothetical protein [Paenibacillus sp. A3]|uniref:hypothetical protein n=1 Tax=Paenibacillus sp. A3 TaxID=1337054 RepID=UPI001ED98DD4|nr:hypothetical protein [Paenibacillus sp. A3]
MNLYTYVKNNPLRFTDPSGHCIPGEDGCGYENDLGSFERSGYTYTKPLREMTVSELGSLALSNNVHPDDRYKIALYAFSMILAPDKGGASTAREAAKNVAETSKVVKQAAKETTELVPLFRAVSPAEFDDIMKTGAFRPDPLGRGYDGKQFSRSFDELLNLTDHFKDTAAIVKVNVPKELLNHLDLTPVDKHILKSGSVTVQPEMLDLFNNSIVGSITHEF